MTTLNPLPYYWVHYNGLIDKIIIDNSIQHFSDIRDKIKQTFHLNIPPQLIKLYYASNQPIIVNKNVDQMVLLDPQSFIRNDGVLHYNSGSNILIQIDQKYGAVNIFKLDSTDINQKPDFIFESGVTWKEISNSLHLPKGVALKRRNSPNNLFAKQPYVAGDYVLVKVNFEKKVILKKLKLYII